ncbi:MAG: KOW motif-containing protein [Deltaproteobacteria bacterium]|jgi:large subunit ribosomal protein L24|nr:KOW motif-containing protein [Deltaproteobacteria bacterium]
MKLKVSKGSTVEVITGSEKGKRGVVLEVDPTKMRVRVQGVKILTKHSKKDGVVKNEGMIDYSNVKLVEAAKKEKGAKKAKSKSKSA